MSILSLFSFFPFLSIYFLVLFSLLYFPLGNLLQFCFPVSALVLFLTGKYNFLFPLFTGSVCCTLFLLDYFHFAHGYCVYSIILIINCLILLLPFVWCSSLVSHFWIFVLICFNYCHNKPLVESSFLTRDQALRLWSVSPDSKTIDHQRTNTREYQIVRPHTKETTRI